MKKQATKTNTKAKKIYNVVSTVIIAAIFVFLVVVVALLLWQRKSGGDSSIFGYYAFDVVTDSMSGTIEPNEVIIAKKVENESELKEGDIITFIAPSGQLAGHNVTHRIVEIVRNEDGSIDYIRTKGDNPNIKEADLWQLKASEVKAKFVRKSPFISGLRNFISKWYGYVLLIALPLTVVGVLIIVGYVRDKLAAEREKAKIVGGVAVENLTEEQREKLMEELKKSSDDGKEENGGQN